MLATRDTYGEHYWPDNGEIDIMEHVGVYQPSADTAVNEKTWGEVKKPD